MASEDSRDFKMELEELVQAVEEERFLQLSGVKVDSSVRDLYDAASPLLDPGNWTPSVTGAGPGPLERYLVQLHLDAAMSGPLDALLTAESSGVMTVPGVGKASLRRAPVLIAELDDRSVRAEVDLLWRGSSLPLAGSAADALAKAASASGALGFDSTAMAAECGMGVPVVETAELATSLLEATADGYGDILSWFIKKKCHMPRELVEEHDLLWLAGPAGAAPKVEFERSMELVLSALGAAGIEVGWVRRRLMDLKSAEGRLGTPLCMALDVPKRVIVLGERRDSLDYAGLYVHELGRALNYSHPNGLLPFELRWLIDPAVAHAWGYLLEGLLLERSFLERLDGGELRKEWPPLGAMLALMRYRRDAAFAAAFVEEGGGPGLGAAVSNVLGSALGIRSAGAMIFRSVGDLLGPFHRLRGLMLGFSLRSYFRARFGDDWCFNPDAGSLMVSLWERGGRLTHEALENELGLVPATVKSAVTEAERALGSWL